MENAIEKYWTKWNKANNNHIQPAKNKTHIGIDEKCLPFYTQYDRKGDRETEEEEGAGVG